MCKRLSQSEFIEKSISIHGDKYDYTETIYISANKKINIICREHGVFTQKASHHTNGSGCKLCKKSKPKLTTDEFIRRSNEIHKNVYDYSETIYTGSHNNVIIRCNKHGKFEQLATNHLSNKGCVDCGIEKNKHDIESYIEKCNIVHNNRYDYTLVDYKNMRTKIDIICKEHGVFKQLSKSHSEGQGCPDCGNKFGIKENKWLDLVGVDIRQYRIGRYVVDGYDDITKTVYEFYGDFWHGNPEIYNSDDVNNALNKTYGELYDKVVEKEKNLKNMGYSIISIWENDYNKMVG